MMRNIDFHLKYCILEGNLKLTASGRNTHFEMPN